MAAARRGHVLGGVWANEAWGRFWGWDPKETWALITWIYAGHLPLPAHKRVWARLTPAGVELGAASHRNADAFRLEFESICAAVGLDGLNQRPALAA